MSSTSPISWLPAEVLLRVFGSLESPLDLYYASLASHKWRRLATYPKLWEEHYWRFYRPRPEDALFPCYEDKRYEAMRRWITKGAVETALTKGPGDGDTQRKLDFVRSRHEGSSRPSSSLPQFLRRPTSQSTSSPDFHLLFVARINRDDQLAVALQAHVHRKTHLMEGMLHFVEEFGDGARDFLAAFAADQYVTAEKVDLFAQMLDAEKSDDGSNLDLDAIDREGKLRALDIHQRGAVGASRPDHRNFLSLQHAARHILGHLHRREAIRAMQKLVEVSSEGKEGPWRQQVVANCLGMEQALVALSLFRSAEPIEMSEYLDLLAIYVWSSLNHRNSSRMPSVIDPLDPVAHSSSRSYEFSASTRGLVAEILDILCALGFGSLRDSNEATFDVNDSFLHLSLWCPAHRQAHPLTFATILCAVARRLGVAATLIETTAGVMTLFMEDDTAPPFWIEKAGEYEWQHFFFVPGFAEEGPPVSEIGEVKQWFAPAQQGGGKVGQPVGGSLFRPLTPARLLARSAGSIFVALAQAGNAAPGQASSPQALDRFKSAEISPELAALRGYLVGNQASPPLPFRPALQSWTRLGIPSTKAGEPRTSPAEAAQDAEYAATWALRFASPNVMGGVPGAHGHIAGRWLKEECEVVAADGAYRTDITLLLEVAGHDVDATLQEAREEAREWAQRWERMKKGIPDDRGAAELLRNISVLRSVATTLFLYDTNPSHGLGGSGAGQPGMRDLNRALANQLLDPAQPINDRVKYRVGTVFQHREDGYYGVVLGWDNVCRMKEDWIDVMEVDAFPSGGRNQPFYSVVNAQDEGSRYIAQCQIRAVRVPTSSPTEDVVAVLRELVPLLNHRTVGKCFRTLRIEPCVEVKEGSGKEAKRARSKKDGQVKLVMNAWMREAWPHD